MTSSSKALTDGPPGVSSEVALSCQMQQALCDWCWSIKPLVAPSPNQQDRCTIIVCLVLDRHEVTDESIVENIVENLTDELEP